MNIVSFAEWLEAVVGISWGYMDNNYSGQQADDLYDEYDWYCRHPEEYAKYFTR